ncbi:aminopeptidase O-like [Macrobrachium rosenbergii]|uniref:aminopeptidase O-like n=1 Tax=Macrobrachium rosenbergii TaxID=79674 RepID=UPI0034D51AE3
MTENDLPLLSNISDSRARHYLISLNPSFETKVFLGRVIIFFEVTSPCEKRGKCCTRKCFCNNGGEVLDISRLEESTLTSGKLSDNNTSAEMNSSVHGELDDTPDFELVLDCCDINIKHVKEVLCNKCEVEDYLDPNHLRNCSNDINFWTSKKQSALQFEVSEWCVKIVKPGIKCVEKFPQVVYIEYETTTTGKSVFWQNDQDGNPCVYTPGAPINNRSLLPCQDPPSAMATWQAWITVSEGYYVSMTGDEVHIWCSGTITMADKKSEASSENNISQSSLKLNPLVSELLPSEDVSTSKSQICFYYCTSMVLPIATIAIAIGKWSVKKLIMPKLVSEKEHSDAKQQELIDSFKNICKHYEYPCHMKKDWTSDTKITVVYPKSFSELTIKALCNFLPCAVKAAVQLLSLYPCHRIEVVILPRNFGSLGLASPNLIFLSPSIAIDDISAFIRIAHEISHAWFGINIGAQDWTEEWISEGFASYMEDLIFTEAYLEYQKGLSSDLCDRNTESSSVKNMHTLEMMVTHTQLAELADLRAHLRYRTLRSELENSNEDLQRLQPMQGESLVEQGISYVKDGLNPEKTFLQIHYLKGYFLLKFLTKIVGKEKFSNAMRAYVVHYHGQLVLSEEILNFFIAKCPKILEEISLEFLLKNWLHQPGLNKETVDMYGVISNSLSLQVLEHFHFWEMFNKQFLKGSGKKLKCELYQLVFPDQVVLLFEYLMELPKIHSRILSNVFVYYKITKMNADVRHRWCELVIKHSFHDLSEVERFLLNDQSMGVYLYGELMITRRANHRKLAQKVFSNSKDLMDENTRITVQTMLYGE